ncbi:MAG: hypothetical protein JST18_08270 [Bacteroidetes bacterium]|nr:hypothetical protein [Bacteroidota bacterium]
MASALQTRTRWGIPDCFMILNIADVNEVFLNLSKIIERDSKSTTYKFALLRGMIDIIQDNSPYISIKDSRAHFPTGLLIEKWLLYYYPILASATSIPQINGEVNLSFEEQFKNLIQGYITIGGYSAFYSDLKNEGIPSHLANEFTELARQLKQTITTMPMKYIGRSVSNNFYSIFHLESRGKNPSRADRIDLQFLIDNFGSFSIPIEYYDALRLFGSFVNGKDSILFKWAEFSVAASGNRLSVDKVLNEVLKSPITQRDVEESKKLYNNILTNEGKVHCVWTGKPIESFDVDHLIPFSIWKNNDLWNLLPAQATINNQKRNKIPAVALIEKQKGLIVHYWELMNQHQQDRFGKEIKTSLLGADVFQGWQARAINRIKESCNYLITTRGYEEWKI